MKIELDNGFVKLAKKYAEMDISISIKRKEWCLEQLSLADMPEEHYSFWHEHYIYFSNEAVKVSEQDLNEIISNMLYHAFNDKVDELKSLEGEDDD